MRVARTVGMLALVLFLAASLPATADVTVTVQISGTIEEILPILQAIQQSGFEKAAAEKLEGLKLEINSTAVEGAPADAAATMPPAEASPAAPPPPPPPPALAAPVVQPATAKPGEQVLITVAVTNPEGLIDTVAAHQAGTGTYAFDLYDNGTRGDAAAGDGVWSYLYTVPPAAADGPIEFELNAFNAAADQVKVKNEAGEEVPLTVHATITVQKPQA